MARKQLAAVEGKTQTRGAGATAAAAASPSAEAAPIGFGGEVEAVGMSTPTQTKAKDVDGVPYCRIHHCRMTQRSNQTKSGGKIYFQCQVKGCKESGIRIKTPNDNVVPKQPQECPHCSRQGRKAICVRNKSLSTGGKVILECPDCNWRPPPFTDPRLAAMHLIRKQGIE